MQKTEGYLDFVKVLVIHGAIVLVHIQAQVKLVLLCQLPHSCPQTENIGAISLNLFMSKETFAATLVQDPLARDGTWEPFLSRVHPCPCCSVA